MKRNPIDFEMKCNFNDIAMRELSLDITDEDRVYDMDTQGVLVFKEKYLRYSDYEFPILRADEIEFNLLENPRLMEILVGGFLQKYSERTGTNIVSLFQSTSVRGDRGYAAFTYIENGMTKELRSEMFINESVRLFNLVCIVNRSEHLYRFEEFDYLNTY